MTNRTVVLLGIGHTNAHIVGMWQRQATVDTKLVCISNFPIATYSGMLPGMLAGQYQPEQMQIDLRRLCKAAGAELVLDDVVGLNLADRQLLFRERPPLAFDALSIGIGSTPNLSGVTASDDRLLAIKPMQTFLQRLQDRLQQLGNSINDRPLRIAIVGGGAGGVEISLCLPSRIETCLGNTNFQMTLVGAENKILTDFPDKAREIVVKLFEQRSVQMQMGQRVVRMDEQGIVLDDVSCIDADLVLWATGAIAPPLLSQFDLPKDDRGFLLTRDTLQSVADALIFAVGDCGTIDQHPTAKAGVYAVRQAPILCKNIQRLLNGQPMLPYRPQPDFLKLLNTGDGKAIFCYRGLVFHGRWCWHLKDQIDRRFIAKYQR